MSLSDMIPCPLCNCVFCWASDLERHLQTHWRLTRKGNGWTMKAVDNPVLAARIRKTGRVTEGRYTHILIADGRLIYKFREKAPAYG